MDKIKGIYNNKWFKFACAATLYICFVVWVNNWFWILGLVVIFDMYITKKVKWAFWKKEYKEGEKRNTWLDWLDAGIFALVAATLIRIFFIEAYVIPSSSMEKSLLIGDYLFVSKVAYGPKMPNTPLSIPLVHNQMSLFGMEFKPYSELVKWNYKRIAGFGKIKRDDVVVFNFPNGDTVIKQFPGEDYYRHARFYGEEKIKQNYELIVRPVDKKDNYVKRCVAISGDSLEIRSGVVYVNGEAQKNIEGMQYSYNVTTNGTGINPLILSKIGVSKDDQNFSTSNLSYNGLPLTADMVSEIEKLSNITSIKKNEAPAGVSDYLDVFPYDERYAWNGDNYGPLWVPQKEASVQLTLDNLSLYQRIISVYEGNKLEVKDGVIYINGEASTNYTFKMDYYFMMGDNRHNSLDSRYWGFVPEDHIVGKAWFIWMSSDKDQSLPSNIRWNRIFKSIK